MIKRATSDIERDWGGPSVSSEWLVLYVRPFELDIQDRGARWAALAPAAAPPSNRLPNADAGNAP